MLLGEPPRTNWDLQFSMFGIPVRVHPLFFVMPLVLGGSILAVFPGNSGVALLVLEAVFFLSILVHELGHAFAFRMYGQHCRIVLYWLGGLAIPETGWGRRRSTASSPAAQIVISAAGPLFGFALAAILVVLVYALGGQVTAEFDGVLPLLFPDFSEAKQPVNAAIRLFFFMGLWANVLWSILNLAPIFPLDGGQISRQIFMMADPWDGVRKSMLFSVIVGAVICVWALNQGDRFMAFMFGYLAFSNYMGMQQMGGGSGPRGW